MINGELRPVPAVPVDRFGAEHDGRLSQAHRERLPPRPIRSGPGGSHASPGRVGRSAVFRLHAWLPVHKIHSQTIPSFR